LLGDRALQFDHERFGLGAPLTPPGEERAHRVGLAQVAGLEGASEERAERVHVPQSKH
jgi:hypothetical protein